jgi:selenium metabolism protein YedF
MRKMVLINSDKMGQGIEEIGHIVMKKFVNALVGLEEKPEKIVLYGLGVKLAAEGSPVMDALLSLENMGVEIMSCGTCLNYYGLAEKIQVGRIGNMPELVKSLMEADDTIAI